MLPSHCHLHLPPIWRCPPCCSIHLPPVWDCSPAAAPTCSPASTEASRARRAPSTPWNGLRWSRQCGTSAGELPGAGGGRGVAGGGGTRGPSCSTSKAMAGPRQPRSCCSVTSATAGSALPFHQTSYSQSLQFPERDRPCRRQMCWWGFLSDIEFPVKMSENAKYAWKPVSAF